MTDDSKIKLTADHFQLAADNRENKNRNHEEHEGQEENIN